MVLIELIMLFDNTSPKLLKERHEPTVYSESLEKVSLDFFHHLNKKPCCQAC